MQLPILDVDVDVTVDVDEPGNRSLIQSKAHATANANFALSRLRMQDLREVVPEEMLRKPGTLAARFRRE